MIEENEETPEQDEGAEAAAGGDPGGQDPSERPRSAADIPQDPPSDAAPVDEAPAEEAPPAGEAPPEPEAAEPEAAEPQAAEPAAVEPEAVEPEAPAEPEAAEAEAVAPEAADVPSEPATDAPAAEKPKAKDQAPGADLEPITLEPERELSAEERARLEAEEEERARLEAEAEAGDEPVARSGPQVELAPDARIQATGKRKSSIARVILRPGSGECRVNGKPLDEYFPRQALRTMARSPLLTAGYESSVDVQVRVHGGGIAGQAGAVRHGIARALTDVDPELRSELKRRGLLTRDARKKERRKAGLKKARKRPQFSKR
jgi:small subunit ribosomal protein S9